MIEAESILAEFHRELSTAVTLSDLEPLRQRYLGKKSIIKNALKSLKDLPKESRRSVAQSLNAAQKEIEKAFRLKLSQAEKAAIEAKLADEWQDLTMPGVSARRGQRHPLTVVERNCMAVLRQMGFELVDGPEVDNAFHNFDALNIPEHHPARDMQDTFWVTGGLLLRSHTTTVQARVLGSKPPLPIRVASSGRVYRNEAVDATHLAMFHQFEGIWIDKGLTFAHLKGVLRFIASSLYGARPIRFKPKFYPYTEPSVGVDIECSVCNGKGCHACHGGGWVTILGAGMVHPKVFEIFGYDPSEVSGIAFGLGTTRMAAQMVNAPALKPLYDQDLPLFSAMHKGGLS